MITGDMATFPFPQLSPGPSQSPLHQQLRQLPPAPYLPTLGRGGGEEIETLFQFPSLS
ncbi:rCG60022 [Rattus norvegicus]|uniref:RCG60022 n=1 Tax=Rattus norvegicus TaxID=10116 RepID=A6HRN1_RAT|nr:rCG60022 [Rattus norvegicus]